MDSRRCLYLHEQILTCPSDIFVGFLHGRKFVPLEMSALIQSMQINILNNQLLKKFMHNFSEQYGNTNYWFITYASFDLDLKAAEYKKLFKMIMKDIHPSLVAQFQEPVLIILTNSVLTANLPPYVLDNLIRELFVIICHTLAHFMVPPPDIVCWSLREPYEPSNSEKLCDNWNWAFISIINNYRPENKCGEYMDLASSFTTGIEFWLSKVTNGYQGMY
jgi:hypothetical protein